MAYPIESLKPTAPEEEQKAALMATVEQLVSEGKSPEEAQAQAMDMLKAILQPSNPMEVPVQQPTDYGINVHNQRARLARSSTGGMRNALDQQFVDAYNKPRSEWNSPWNPSPPGPQSTVNR